MKKPFLKWTGNKFRLLNNLLPLIGSPQTFCEPFGGSFVVSLNVSATYYILNDYNENLINVYNHLLESPLFIKQTKEYFKPENNSSEMFYDARKQFNQTNDKELKAKLFVYLNRHCFNGITRFNNKNEFNVPFGKYKTVKFPEQELNQFRNYFTDKTIHNKSFESDYLYSNLQKGDVVYFDPPYYPVSNTSNFTKYAKDDFTIQHQKRLAEVAKSLSESGIKVIVSNSNVDECIDLYQGAEIIKVDIYRSIAANSQSRKSVKEIIAVF